LLLLFASYPSRSVFGANFLNSRMDNEAQDEEAFSSEVTTEDAVLLVFSNFEEDSFLLLFVVVNESYAGGGGVAVVVAVVGLVVLVAMCACVCISLFSLSLSLSLSLYCCRRCYVHGYTNTEKVFIKNITRIRLGCIINPKQHKKSTLKEGSFN